MKNIFDNVDLLRAYDNILPKISYYNKINQIHVEELKDCKSILDIGCGTGFSTTSFLLNNHNVTALDISQKSIQILLEKVKHLDNRFNLKILNCDALKLPNKLKNTFDGVNCMIAAHLFKDIDRHFKQVFMTLKKGGKFALTLRIKGKNQEVLVNKVNVSLNGSIIEREIQEDYNIICNSLLLTANERTKSRFTELEIENKLKIIGFTKLKSIQNDSSGVMSTLICTKP